MRRELGAVVLAAGRGERLGGPVPKAYVPLAGKPLLLHSLEKFARFPPLCEIVLVIHPEDEERFRTQVEPRIPLPAHVEFKRVYGGEHRQDSALAGVRAASSEWVAVHDAARPFFSLDLLEALWEAVREHRAALPVLPVEESLHELGPGEERLLRPVDRSRLLRAQTPQCFERRLLADALREARRRGERFTDEAGAVLAYGGVSPFCVSGEEWNLKITTRWDLEAAEAWVQAGLLPLDSLLPDA